MDHESKLVRAALHIENTNNKGEMIEFTCQKRKFFVSGLITLTRGKPTLHNTSLKPKMQKHINKSASSFQHT